jgi:hypothetical protein
VVLYGFICDFGGIVEYVVVMKMTYGDLQFGLWMSSCDDHWLFRSLLTSMCRYQGVLRI